MQFRNSVVGPEPARPSRWLVLAVVLQLAFAAGSLHAQDAAAGTGVPEAESSGASTIVYGPEFFAQYNVITAEDILRRIPGVSAMLDDSGGGGGGDGARRGFGSDGDQILINGRRLAGKSNEISSALRRIQVQNLERVELLRGTTGDIDVRSDGVVVNIVLKAGESASSSGSVMLASQHDDGGWLDMDGAVNYNGDVGRLTYFVGVARDTLAQGGGGGGGFTRRVRDERFYYPGGELMQIRDNESTMETDEYTLVMNSTYRSERGDSLQLNGLISVSDEEARDVIPFAEFDVDGTPLQSGVELNSEVVDRRLEWEFGGTYERSMGDSGNIKILTVYTHDETSKVDDSNEIIDDIFYEDSRNPSDDLRTEAIVRGSWFGQLSGSQTIEIGAEAALNTLEQTIQVFADLDEDGIAEEIDIFNPSSKVEEGRTEIFANHNWTLNDRWTASSSLVIEKSTITQTGADVNNETGFDFVKPRVDVRYSPTGRDQWRFKVEKTVSQLNFGNFVPQYNIREDRYSAGNPDLRPELAWEYEIGYEHRLAADEGTIEARVYYKDIEDRIEEVAIDVDDDGDLDPASGNIGDATEYGVEVSFSLRMARLGVPNLILDGSYLQRETSVTDPFTGLERDMNQSWSSETSVGLRHDIASQGVSYGITYEAWGGANERRDWREYRYFTRSPEFTAFAEKRFASRWTLRFDALDLSQSVRERTRQLYAQDAIDGALRRTEYFEDTRDRRYTLSLTATF